MNADTVDVQLVKDLEKVLGSRPIDEIAPLLIVAVARLLVIDADHDPERLGFLIAKFLSHLTATVNDMIEDGDLERRH